MLCFGFLYGQVFCLIVHISYRLFVVCLLASRHLVYLLILLMGFALYDWMYVYLCTGWSGWFNSVVSLGDIAKAGVFRLCFHLLLQVISLSSLIKVKAYPSFRLEIRTLTFFYLVLPTR